MAKYLLKNIDHLNRLTCHHNIILKNLVCFKFTFPLNQNTEKFNRSLTFVKQQEPNEDLINKYFAENDSFNRDDLVPNINNVINRKNFTKSDLNDLLSEANKRIQLKINPSKYFNDVNIIWNLFKSIHFKITASQVGAMLSLSNLSSLKLNFEDVMKFVEKNHIEFSQEILDCFLERMCHQGDEESASKIFSIINHSYTFLYNKNTFTSMLILHGKEKNKVGIENELKALELNEIKFSASLKVALATAYFKCEEFDLANEALSSAELLNSSVTAAEFAHLLVSYAKSDLYQKNPEFFGELYNCKSLIGEVDFRPAALALAESGFSELAVKTLLQQADYNNDVETNTFVFREIVKSLQYESEVIDYCKTCKPLLDCVFEEVLQDALTQEKRELSFSLLREIKNNNRVLHQHYFWPLFACPPPNSDVVVWSQTVLRLMAELDVSVDIETIFDWVLRLWHDLADPEVVWQMLRDADVRYSVSIAVAVAQMIRKQDVSSVMRLVQEHDVKWSNALSLCLENVSYSDENTASKVAEMKMHFHVPFDHEKRVVRETSKLDTAHDLEYQLSLSKAENDTQESHWIISKLLTLYCNSLNHVKLNKILDEITRSQFKLKGNHYSSLMRYYIETKDVEGALKYYQIIKSLYPDFPLDAIRIIRLSHLLVCLDRFEESISLLESFKPRNVSDLSGKRTIVKASLKLVEEVARRRSLEEAQRVIQSCLPMPDRKLYGIFVRLKLEKGDYAGAVQDAFDACRKRRVIPEGAAIMVALINEIDKRRTNNLETSELSQLLESMCSKFESIYDIKQMHHKLIFAYVNSMKNESELKDTLKNYMNSLDSSSTTQQIKWWAKSRMDEPIRRLLVLLRDTQSLDRPYAYDALLTCYCLNRNYQQAMKLPAMMQEENVVPQEGFANKLEWLLKTSGHALP